MGHSARYELKYVIQEPRAVAVADFVSSYLRPSVHNGSGPIRGHPVISLYMDSPDFFFFRQAFTGHKNRMKLRIRFYDGDWNRPAFLEVKRRVSEVICKDRAMITREGVRQILSQGWPIRPFFPDMHPPYPWPPPAGCQPMISGALPTSSEAAGPSMSPTFARFSNRPTDEELRVTLDRRIHGSRYDGRRTPRTSPSAGGVPTCRPYMARSPRTA